MFDMVYELAQRGQNGLLVRLLWDSIRDRVIVRYRDRLNGDAFTAQVRKAQALVAFNHPNAFRPA